MSFAKTLEAGFASGKHLCVGIDPHAHLLAEWGLADDANGAEKFGREVVLAAAESGQALCLKPQIAFFERFGVAGYQALEKTLQDARDANLSVIADIKRGDIGSTFTAYAQAWLTPGAPLEVDAITATPFMGVHSLSGAFDLVDKHGKGMFILAATSNPEAQDTQQAIRMDGRTVTQEILDEVESLNESSGTKVGPYGVVLGATLNLDDFGINKDAAYPENTPIIPILAPGFGAQGAKIQDAKQIFGSLVAGLIANESRSVLAGGAQGLADRISSRAEIIREAL